MFLLALCSAIGLSSLIIASPVLFKAIKLLGAAYLFYLGGKIVINNLPKQNKACSTPTVATTQLAIIYKRLLWREHFLVAISNPKALLFFTALFPQFIEGLSWQFLPLHVLV